MLIRHSDSIRNKKIEETMARHRNGDLPKSEYASNGQLYGKAMMGVESPNECARRDAAKDKEASYKKEEFVRKSNEDMRRIAGVAQINQLKKKYY